MSDDAETPYRAQAEDGRSRVVDETGRLIVGCGDMGNAEQYAALLNQAYRRGYKAGYRAARRS
jgi:hypothetical protein